MVFNADGVLIEHTLDGVPQPLGAPHAAVVRDPVPEPEWPLWAKALKRFAKLEDKGIGDVVARIIGAENSEKFNKWHLATFGKPCGCKGKQARWNRMYPLLATGKS